MSLRLKIFVGACAICVAARLAEYHFQQGLVVPAYVPEQRIVLAKPDVYQDNFERKEFLQFEAQARAISAETGLAAGEKLLVDDPMDSKGRAGNFLLSLCDA